MDLFPDPLSIPADPTSFKASTSCSANDTSSDDITTPTATDTQQDNYDSDDDHLNSNEETPTKRRKLELSHTGVKCGSTWAQQKAIKERLLHDSTFSVSDRKLSNFREKVKNDDPYAEFKASNPCSVRCSSCRVWVEMRLLYDLFHWRNHRKTKKCQRARAQGGHTRSLLCHGFGVMNPSSSGPLPQASSIQTLRPSYPEGACPGLTRESDEKIAQYLLRSSATGGGAPSRESISRDLFQDETLRWRQLTIRQQRIVRRREQVLYKWINSRATGAIFSTQCEANCQSPH